MPHVSKEKLNDKLYAKLFTELVELQTNLSKGKSTRFMNSLLTPTEQIMLTKRCAAAVMFTQGYSNYRVWTLLKISQSTAARLRDQYDQGVFDGIVENLFSKKQKQAEHDAFITTLEKVLRLGMPSMGKDRWKSLQR